RVQEDPFIPVYWGENQSGMQAAKEIADWKKPKAEKLWLEARDHMIRIASILASKTCPECQGKGSVEVSIPVSLVAGADSSEETYRTVDVSCAECNGTGE